MLGIEGNLAALVVEHVVQIALGLLLHRLGIEVADVVSLKHLGGLGRVDGGKVLGSIGTGVDGDTVDSTGMELEVFGAVVDLVVDNDPHILLGVVLLDLLHGEDLLGILGRRRGRGGVLLITEDLEETSKAGRVGLASGLGHPATGLLTRLSGMLEAEHGLAVGSTVHVDLDAEDLVVAHTHEVPCRVHRLDIVTFVQGTAHDLLASDEVADGDLVAPPHPAPVHAVLVGLLLLVDLAHIPVDATIPADLDTADLASTTGVGISSDLVLLVDLLGDAQSLVVVGLRDGRVDVELVEDVFGLVPPVALEGLLGGNVRGEDAVVVVVVVVLGLVGDDVDGGEPLDHTTTDVTRDDETDGEAVIRLKTLTVGLVGNDDVKGRVHGAAKGDGGSVLDCSTKQKRTMENTICM